MHMDYSDPMSGALSPDFLGAEHSFHTLDDFSMASLGQVVGSNGRLTAMGQYRAGSFICLARRLLECVRGSV